MEGVITRNAHWKGNSEEYYRVILIGGSRKQHTCKICHSYFFQYFELKEYQLEVTAGIYYPPVKQAMIRKLVGWIRQQATQASPHTHTNTHTHSICVCCAPSPFLHFRRGAAPPVFYCFLQGQPRGALTSIKRVGAKGQEELRRGGDKVREA
jgi:hypothetical protein